MSSHNIHITLMAALWPACAFLSSCIYDYPGDCVELVSLRIENEWIPDSSPRPEGMGYIFFPEEGGPSWRFDLPCGGGNVLLPPGRYGFLSCSDDTRNVIFRDEAGYSGFEAASTSAALPFGHPSVEKVFRPPDMLWGCAYPLFTLSYTGATWLPPGAPDPVMSPQSVLTAVQRPLTALYSFRIEEVDNLKAAGSLAVSISGLAGSLFIASGQKGEYPATVVTEASATDASTIGGSFLTFGIPAGAQSPNILTLYVTEKGRRGVCYRFDVTAQVRSAPDPMNVEIVIRGLKIDNPGDSEAGFDIEVDGWVTETVNISD